LFVIASFFNFATHHACSPVCQQVRALAANGMDTRALKSSTQLQYYSSLALLIASVVLAAATFSWLDTDAVAWVPIICASFSLARFSYIPSTFLVSVSHPLITSFL
jgi:hypothetical protein